ncbi:unnamed protein product [Parajaminaea phylloscopi]
MTDWTSQKALAQLNAASQAMLWICVGVTLREQIALWSFDWSLIVGKRRRRAPQIAYFAAKVCWWAYASINIVALYGKGPYNCNALLEAIESLMGLIALSSSLLLACRTVCVFQGDARRYVTWILYIFSAGLAAAWFAGVTDVHAEWFTDAATPFTNGACGPAAVKMRYFVKYLVTIVFDAFVLILTIVGVVRMSRNGGTRIGALIVDQGLFYFIATFLANLLVTVFTLLQLSPMMSLFWAIPSSAVCMTASTRLYVQLAEQASHRPDGVSNEHIQSGGSASEKIVNFLARVGGRNGGSGPGTVTWQSGRHGSAVTPEPFATHSAQTESDIEKQGSHETLRKMSAPDSLRSNEPQQTRLSHPFASVFGGGNSNSNSNAAPTTAASTPSRFAVRSSSRHNHTNTNSTTSGVVVSQTRTEREEPIPEYLVTPAFLTPDQMARLQPESDEARRYNDPVAHSFQNLSRASRDGGAPR